MGLELKLLSLAELRATTDVSDPILASRGTCGVQTMASTPYDETKRSWTWVKMHMLETCGRSWGNDMRNKIILVETESLWWNE